MSLHTFFPHLRGFRLLSSSRESKRLVLICERVTPPALCPVCGTAAHRIHSRDPRTVWDLSVQNVQVVLHLHVRKFYCDRSDCPRRITASRLPQVTSPHGRFTFGLREFLAQLGREQGGAAGARSAHLQGVQATPRAILRLMHALPLPPIAAPRIIGLDEWAWRRGQCDGALVVDRERKKPLALLPDRSRAPGHPLAEMLPDHHHRGAGSGKASLPPLLQRLFPTPSMWPTVGMSRKTWPNTWIKSFPSGFQHLTKGAGEAEMPTEPLPICSPARRPRQSVGEAR